MKKHIKLIIIGIVALAAIGVGVYQSMQPVDVKVYTVEKNTLVDSFREEGIVQSDGSYLIYPAYSGKIKSIVKVNDQVSKGQLLLEMDTEPLETQKKLLQSQIQSLSGQRSMSQGTVTEAQISSAQLAVEAAENHLQEMEKQLERQRTLYEAGGIPAIDLENAENALADAQRATTQKKLDVQILQETSREKPGTSTYYNAQIAGLNTQIAEINKNIQESKQYARENGRVILSNGETGGSVAPISPVLEIEEGGNLIVKTDVSTQNASALKLGDKVQMLFKSVSGDIVFDGNISEIESFAHEQISALGLKEQRVNVKVQPEDQGAFANAKIENRYNMTLVFETFRKEDAEVINKTSYFEEDGKNYVWLVEDGKLQKKEITKGYEASYQTEILSGLTQGEVIVLDPNNSVLKENLRINLVY